MEETYGAADSIDDEFPSVSARPSTAQLLYRKHVRNQADNRHSTEDKNDQFRDGSDAEFEALPERVVKILMERKDRGYRRGIDDDGHKVGLAFDPGAYAGVISLAMARKLEVAGLLEYVDAFYGLSAGGVNAAYAAAGQVKEGMDTYLNLMPDNNLLTPGRLIPPRLPKMDLDVLRDAIYRQHPLKIRELINSKIPVVVGMTNLYNTYDQKEVARSTDADPEHPEKFMEKLVMGCAIPFLTGKRMLDPDSFDAYTDATLSWADSVELARSDGCTHILSLANTPPLADDKKSLKSRFTNYAIGRAGDWVANRSAPIGGGSNGIQIEGLDPGLAYIFDALDSPIIRPYSDALKRKDAAEHAYSEGLFVDKGVVVERIYPPALPGLPEIFTADKRRLKVGIRAGRLAIREALDKAKKSQPVKVAA